MAASLDPVRLVEISQELILMGWRGARPRRLSRLALELLLARGAAMRVAEGTTASEVRRRAKRMLAFVEKLEGQVLRLYIAHQAAHRGLAGLTPGGGFVPRGR